MNYQCQTYLIFILYHYYW